MSLQDYLSPVSQQILQMREHLPAQSLIHFTHFHEQDIPSLEDVQLAVIGVKEGRLGHHFSGSDQAPDQVRTYFYKLIKPKFDVKLVDLGNIEQGNTIQDTLFALKQCINELVKLKVIPIILGGTQELAYGQFSGYQGLKHSVNLAVCDSKLDLKQADDPGTSGYLFKCIAHQPNYLFNVVHLASQNYFIEQESLDAFEKMNFDLVRLGLIRGKIQEIEPLLRNSDMLVMSMNSLKASDAPASVESNPNGLYAEEACQLIRYAGMGNDLSSFGLYDLNPADDVNDRTVKLASQMLWYFLDGFYNRRNDYPVEESKDYMIYRTTFKSSSHEIVFYKHIHSDRWWMQVPYPKERSGQRGMFFVPCNYSDYQDALQDEIPDRWMKAYHKLL